MNVKLIVIINVQGFERFVCIYRFAIELERDGSIDALRLAIF